MSGVTPRSERRAQAAGCWQPWVKAGVGAGMLCAIVMVTGTEPFVRGLASVSPMAVAAAVVLAGTATAAAAWRWRVLARRLGLPLGWRESVAAYYRSQFLNTVLPGGVVGDIERAVSHGRRLDRTGQAVRAVAAERTAGQVVQLVLALAVVGSIGLSVYAPAMVLLLVVLGLVGVVAGVAMVSVRARRALRREAAILRDALGSVRALLAVVAASALVVGAHVVTFLVACVAAGVVATPEQAIVAALAAVLASSIPLSIGGWGPREGAAAWAFAAAGLGAAAGITAATVYGVLTTMALAPGAVVVAVSLLRRRHASAQAGGRAAA